VDYGTAACRASFLLSRWNGTHTEIQLPPLQSLEVYVDGRKADGFAKSESGMVSVPLPEPKTGKLATIELRYRTPLPRDSRRVRQLALPLIRKSLLKNPMRWYLGSDAADAPLLLPNTSRLELEWAWRGLGFAPKAAATPTELEQWFLAGTQRETPDANTAIAAEADSLAGRITEPAMLEFCLVPRSILVLVASALAFGIGLGCSRMPQARLGMFAGVVAIAVAILSVLAPQPLAQVVAAVQPGLFGLALFLLGKLGFDAVLRRRVDRLPAFSRGTTTALSASIRDLDSRPSRNPIEAVIAPRSPSASKG